MTGAELILFQMLVLFVLRQSVGIATRAAVGAEGQGVEDGDVNSQTLPWGPRADQDVGWSPFASDGMFEFVIKACHEIQDM